MTDTNELANIVLYLLVKPESERLKDIYHPINSPLTKDQKESDDWRIVVSSYARNDGRSETKDIKPEPIVQDVKNLIIQWNTKNTDERLSYLIATPAPKREEVDANNSYVAIFRNQEGNDCYWESGSPAEPYELALNRAFTARKRNSHLEASVLRVLTDADLGVLVNIFLDPIRDEIAERATQPL